ncbi:RNA polymerase sigma factor [Silvibacterium sp.]|uniref:RNA polymerase sigma factor n=1 Tax=Silvibacterium sp. TaxID=1964179 RepID=UPI0039E684DB
MLTEAARREHIGGQPFFGRTVRSAEARIAVGKQPKCLPPAESLEKQGLRKMNAIATADCMDLAPHGEIKSRFVEKSRSASELDDIDGLVRTYRAQILRFVTFTTGDPDLTETITQDTMLRAYMGRESFRGECSVKTWLTGIAINLTRDHLRSAKYKFWKQAKATAIDVHEMAAFLPSAGSSPERQVLAKEKVKELAKVLATLSIKQRTVFLMKFSHEIPVAEIGEILGMQTHTVRTHLHRALSAVRSQLGAKL